MIVHSRVLTLVILLLSSPVMAKEVPVATDAEFHAALRDAKAGDHIRLGPGPFKGGFFATGLAGTKEAPIRISGPSIDKPAVIHSETATAMQLVKATYIEVENLHITRAGGHGLAFDDGGEDPFSCNNITIRNCRIENVGPRGGTCGIKMAGVSDFLISDCTFRNWGEAGDAVDGVGCRQGVVERCTFLPGHGSAAVQFKGGSESVTIRGCRFEDLSDTGVNIGGATGERFFRPKPLGFEARNIVVEVNTFIGCVAPVLFSNIDGADVRFNTIYVPKRWAFRIHQQTVRDDFPPCRNGRIEDNIFVFKSTQWFEGGINIGPKTAPETFRFSRNLWYCIDKPALSTPTLPSKEMDAVIGQDPRFVDPGKGDFSLQATSPAKGKGHTALEKSEESKAAAKK